MPFYPPPPNSVEEKTPFVFFVPHKSFDSILISKGASSKMFNLNTPKSTDSASNTKLECTPETLVADNVPIQAFQIPQGWEQTRRSAKWGFGGNTGYNYEFSPKSKRAKAGLSIDWDGRTIDETHRAAWRDIFAIAPHELDKGELAFLDEVIKLNYADPTQYKLNSARTIDWNGRMVVEIDGQTISENEPVFHCFAIAFDNYGDLSSAGVIRFSATKELFEKYKNDALKSMKEIRWRKQNNSSAD